MAANYLPGITHAIVTIPSKEDALATGVRAQVEFFHGPGDNSSFGLMELVKHDDELAWRCPLQSYVKNGVRMLRPVARGDLFEQLCYMAQRAVERVKRDCGIPQFAKEYRVFTGDAKTQIEEPAAA